MYEIETPTVVSLCEQWAAIHDEERLREWEDLTEGVRRSFEAADKRESPVIVPDAGTTEVTNIPSPTIVRMEVTTFWAACERPSIEWHLNRHHGRLVSYRRVEDPPLLPRLELVWEVDDECANPYCHKCAPSSVAEQPTVNATGEPIKGRDGRAEGGDDRLLAYSEARGFHHIGDHSPVFIPSPAHRRSSQNEPCQHCGERFKEHADWEGVGPYYCKPERLLSEG